MRFTVAVLAVCCCLSAVSGQWVETTTQPAASPRPGFDPKDVVRQVRSGPSAGSHEPSVLDDGEFLIDTSITYVPAPEWQVSPAVSFDGANFLVVWQDDRSGSTYDIYAARVTPAGTVLDPAGIAVSTASGDQGSPALAFDGTSFLVAWADLRSGSPGIYGARVTPAGVVLDPAGIAISTAADYDGSPAVAFDGANFLVVWQDDRSGGNSDIYGARVTPAGAVLDPQGIAVSTVAGDQRSPVLAFGGASFLVAWTDFRSGGYSDIYGARVTPAGAVLDPQGIAVSISSSYARYPALAFDGANFLVVWEDFSSLTISDIYGARVTAGGVVLDTLGIAVSTAADYQWFPAVVSDGTDFLVAWEDWRSGSSIYGARVTSAGVVLDPQGIAVSTTASGQGSPALAFDGTSFLVAWSDSRSVSPDIYGARVTPAAVVLDPTGIAVSRAADCRWLPAVVSDGANFLVVWQDSRNGDSTDIYGARVTPAGVVLDTTGFAISTAARNQCGPALAFDGANFLVVWQDSRNGDSTDIYGARVTPAGEVLDPAGIAVSTAADDQGYPVVAFDGASFLVAWTDWRSGYTAHIYGARVTPAGTVLDPSGVAISNAAQGQLSPAVEFDGVNFLVVWEDLRGGSYDIYGARVTPAGGVLDTAGFAISTTAYDQFDPALAHDGGNFLVVWQYNRLGNSTGIYGARVTPAGVVPDSEDIAISTASEYQGCPAVAFDGESFLVVWADFRGGSYDIYGARVTPAGVVSDSGPVVRQEGEQSYAALARGSGNDMFLAYQGWTGTVGGKTYNIDRIWGKMNPSTAVAETTKPEVRVTNSGATIIRGVLFLAEASSRKPQVASLLDISGRKVLDLKPGPNDVRALAPGVYFVREEPQAASHKPQAVRKVVVTR